MTDQKVSGRPAKGAIIVCSHCGNKTFELLCPAPSGLMIGDKMPPGVHPVSVAECCACGEIYQFHNIGIGAAS